MDIRVLFLAAIVLAAGGRAVALLGAVGERDSISIADRVRLAEQIQRQVFDPDAAVLLAPGEDGLPGQAGLDDDFDGVTDNRSEMGAVGSDDLCLAPSNQGYQRAIAKGTAVTIGRGAFVPDANNITPGDATAAALIRQASASGDRVRFQVTGRADGIAWSRMICGPAH